MKYLRCLFATVWTLLLLASLSWSNPDYKDDELNACLKDISHSADAIADLKKCEKSIKSISQRNDRAKTLLYLGRMHLQLPNALMYRFASTGGSHYSEGKKKFNTFGKSRPNEYYYNEIGGQYIYNGYHFKKIIDSFSETEYVDDAAFEMAKLPQGGECEGWLDCYIERSSKPIYEFLVKYSSSPLASDAVAKANSILQNSFDSWFKYFGSPKDLAQPSEGYDPPRIKASLYDYEKSTKNLRKEDRASAFMAIAAAWSCIGNKSEADRLYHLILKEIPEHPGSKEALQNLSKEK